MITLIEELITKIDQVQILFFIKFYLDAALCGSGPVLYIAIASQIY